MAGDALVIFTPSGKRGRFATGTPVLTAARQLGVDLDSVCGGRGICSKCQVSPGVGAFPKHGVTVAWSSLWGHERSPLANYRERWTQCPRLSTPEGCCARRGCLPRLDSAEAHPPGLLLGRLMSRTGR